MAENVTAIKFIQRSEFWTLQLSFEELYNQKKRKKGLLRSENICPKAHKLFLAQVALPFHIVNDL